eukprot:11190024-Lingulodinium_polyedra.AAC.1
MVDWGNERTVARLSTHALIVVFVRECVARVAIAKANVHGLRGLVVERGHGYPGVIAMALH